MIDHMRRDATPTATTRALEIVLSGDDFDADVADRYGWMNRTLDDDDLDSFVETLVRRLASFDREALAAAKARINRFGMQTATELQSSNDLFFPTLAWPSSQARRAKIRGIGYGLRSDFELNFGRYLHAFGRARRHGCAARLIVAHSDTPCSILTCRRRGGMAGRKVVVYHAWSWPGEVEVPLEVIENRYPTLFREPTNTPPQI